MTSQARRRMVQRIVKAAEQTGACATVDAKYEYMRVRRTVHYLHDGSTAEIVPVEPSETCVTVIVTAKNGNGCSIGIKDAGVIAGTVWVYWHDAKSNEPSFTTYERDRWADAIRDAATNTRAGGMT